MNAEETVLKIQAAPEKLTEPAFLSRVAHFLKNTLELLAAPVWKVTRGNCETRIWEEDGRMCGQTCCSEDDGHYRCGDILCKNA